MFQCLNHTRVIKTHHLKAISNLNTWLTKGKFNTISVRLSSNKIFFIVLCCHESTRYNFELTEYFNTVFGLTNTHILIVTMPANTIAWISNFAKQNCLCSSSWYYFRVTFYQAAVCRKKVTDFSVLFHL